MSTEMGMNRTGVQTSPIDSKEAEQAAQAVPPTSPGGADDALRIRAGYAREAPPIGSVPPPGSVRGVVTAAAQLLTGKSPAALIDKLGQRLAFERSGTRLYEALLAKLDATGSFHGGPSREEIHGIHDDELGHFHLLRRSIEGIGADPTAMTPAADVVGVASLGLYQVVTDPRTTLAQSLEAILVAELTDADSWRRLIEVAEVYGQDDMARDFRAAEAAEQRHVALVRAWVDAAAQLEARGKMEEERPGQEQAA